MTLSGRKRYALSQLTQIQKTTENKLSTEQREISNISLPRFRKMGFSFCLYGFQNPSLI